MARFKETAQQLAIACLSQESIAKCFVPGSAEKIDAVIAGERVGEFYRAILKTLEEKPRTH